MKKTFAIYVISIFSISLIGGWVFSKYSMTPRAVVSSDWEGKWVMDSVGEKGPIHSVLQLSTVSNQGFKYGLSYTYDDSTGGDSSSDFSGKAQVFGNEITQTWYLDDGSKNVVRTLTLSKDKQSINLYEDTCPGIFNVSPTPDGCEIPVYDGTYYHAK